MGFSTFVGQATTTLHVPVTAGSPIPIQMPSGVVAGDKLVAFLENAQVNPVSITGPSGWTGTLSTGLFTKTADGTEDGAILNWTTQNTTGNGPSRVIVAAVVCYRISVVPLSESRFFQNFNSSSSSATLSHIPSTGIVGGTQLRIYCAFGQRADGPFFPTLQHTLTGITWTNPTDRTGMISLPWSGSTDIELNDSTSASVADIEYNFPPPFNIYNPNDAVTLLGGAASTGGTLHTVVYNLPGFFLVNYWGINATTPA